MKPVSVILVMYPISGGKEVRIVAAIRIKNPARHDEIVVLRGSILARIGLWNIPNSVVVEIRIKRKRIQNPFWTGLRALNCFNTYRRDLITFISLKRVVLDPYLVSYSVR